MRHHPPLTEADLNLAWSGAVRLMHSRGHDTDVLVDAAAANVDAWRAQVRAAFDAPFDDDDDPVVA